MAKEFIHFLMDQGNNYFNNFNFRFEGYWKNGIREGNGILCYENGDR